MMHCKPYAMDTEIKTIKDLHMLQRSCICDELYVSYIHSAKTCNGNMSELY